jgi:hypothetical protein
MTIQELNRKGREVYELREDHKADGCDDSYDRWDRAADDLADLVHEYASENHLRVAEIPLDNYSRDALRDPVL